MPRDIPIIFSAPMVRALLEGRKLMTRRLAWKKRLHYPGVECRHGHDACPICDKPPPSSWQRARPGDRLWVRENFSRHLHSPGCWYWADGNVADLDSERPHPSIHMPRWASRLTLEVTAAKVERLREISEADARAEGVLYVPGHGDITPIDLMADPGYSNFLNCRQGFEVLWNSLHGFGAWEANPEVVAISFAVHKRNIDA